MFWFKKKRKRSVLYGDTQYEDCLTEQEYVDHKFNNIENDLKYIKNDIKLLQLLNRVVYLLIYKDSLTTIKNKNGERHRVLADEAREYAKDNGFEYIGSIKDDELWVKKEK